jgi:Fur family ferric uptake transcriptional regulator
MSAPSSTRDEILAAIRHSGGRVTTTKRALIDVLVSSTEHLTAEEITAEIQRNEPDASSSTIYRNLEELEGLGFVVHSHLGRAAAVYHLAGPVHGHLLCSNCAATIEVPSETFEPLVRAMRREYGFDVDRHHLALSGLCSACQRR